VRGWGLLHQQLPLQKLQPPQLQPLRYRIDDGSTMQLNI
jgi:hypothetical protein